MLCANDTKQAAVIDPGGELPRLPGDRRTKVKIEKIWVTHGHIDHAGAVAEMRDELGVPIEGPHRDEEFLIGRMSRAASSSACQRPQRGAGPLARRGRQGRVGTLEVGVLHCPGHTPGTSSSSTRRERFAMVGDVLFAGSIGRTDFPRGDHPTLLESIIGKLWPLGDDVTFISGHGEPSTIGRERASNPFLK